MGTAVSTGSTKDETHSDGGALPGKTGPPEGVPGSIRDDGAATPDDQNLAAMPVQVAAMLKLPAPPAKPPSKKKYELCQQSRFLDIDSKVLELRADDVGVTIFDFSTRLTAIADPGDDVGRLRALFYWLASVDLDSTIKAAGPKGGEQADNTIVSYLLKIQRRKGNYAHLLAALCNCAGIPARIVTGVTKNATYRVGKPIDRASAVAQWNAVHVAGEWRLLDCLWSSVCVEADDGDSSDWELLDIDGERVKKVTRQQASKALQPPPSVSSAAITAGEAGATAVTAEVTPVVTRRINDFFFLPDPAELGATHFPNDAEWQLVDPPTTWTAFEEGAYVRERFFQLGARTTRPELGRCALRADDSGAIVIELEVAAADSPSVTFKYALSRAKADRGDRGGDDDGAVANAFNLHKCVFFEQRGKLIRYTVRFPVRGDYKFDVYGRDSRAHAGHDLMCSYMVTSEDRCEHFAPLPDEPAIGWGPGASCDAFGLTAVSHPDGRIDADSGEMDIVFALQYPIELRHELLSAAPATALAGRKRVTSPHAGYSILTVHEGVATVSLRIAHSGVYVLKLFAGEECIPAELQNVCNYLITLGAPATTAAGCRAYPSLADGHLGMTSYGRELCVEPVTRCHPVILTADRHVDAQFACDGTVELYAAVSTTRGEPLDGATSDRCRRSLACEGCYNFRVDVGNDFELLLRLYACRAGDRQRLYNVYNCLVRAPRNAAADSTAAVAGCLGTVDELVAQKPTVTIPLARFCSDPGIVLTKTNSYLPPASHQATLVTSPSGGGLLSLKLADRGEYGASIYEKSDKGFLLPFKKYCVFREGDGGDDGEDANDGDAIGRDDYSDALAPGAGDEADDNDDYSAVGAAASDASSATVDPDKRRAARQALRRAMNAGVLAIIQKAIADHLASGGAHNDDLLKAARRLVTLLQAEEALRQAMDGNSVKSLRDALAHARALNVLGKLNATIKMAERKLAVLQFADQLSKAVFSLDQRAMSEMRAYAHPPEVVYWVAKATLLLLGNHYTDVQDWRQVQVWLGRTGAESLKRRVMAFDYRTTPVDSVGVPKEVYGRYTLAEVRAVSAGAATFYVWGSGMIGLIEQLAVERQEKQATVG